MKFKIQKRSIKFKKTDTVVIFFFEDDKKIKSSFVNKFKFLMNIDLAVFHGKVSDILFIPFTDNPSLIICGLGKKELVDSETLRNVSAGIISNCRNREITGIHVDVPQIDGLSEADAIRQIAEGLALSNYSYTKYKTKNGDDIKPLVESVIFISDTTIPPDDIREIETLSGNTILCRDLVNEVSENCNPLSIAKNAGTLSGIKGIQVKIYEKKDIEKMKMGLFLAVNKGSSIPPKLVVITYTGNPKNKKYLALVGKGITFDSGGMNLKPSGHMETMRMDMSGAAAVLFAIKTAAELRLKKNLYAVMPLTENMLSNNSYRPGDIFRSYTGKTVEIGNTDAEGRLILADAIAFTADKLKPEYIIDIATLTGSCIATFGETVAGYLSNDDTLASMIESASARTGEKTWRLPLFPEYDECIKSDIADLNNISSEKNAGAIIGAVFLKNFTGNTKWAHIDIAGTAWYSKPRGYVPKFATGYGVRLLFDILNNWKP